MTAPDSQAYTIPDIDNTSNYILDDAGHSGSTVDFRQNQRVAVPQYECLRAISSKGASVSRKTDNIRTLKAYLALNQRWCTARELATRLHTSTRSIRSYIASINASALGEQPIVSSQKGYRWRESHGNRLVEANPFALPQTPHERMYYYLRNLLNAGPIDIYDVAEDLAVSDWTVQADLPELRAICRACGLALVQHASTYSIEGPECARRRLALICILQTTHVEIVDRAFCIQMFPELDGQSILEALDTVLDAAISIDDIAYGQLALALFIQLYRTVNGIRLEEMPYLPAQAAREATAAATLADALEARMNILLPDEERAYLAAALYAYAAPAAHEIAHDDAYEHAMHACVERALAFTTEHLPLLIPAAQLIDEVCDWAMRMLTRKRNDFMLTNPVAFRLRAAQPMAYDMSAWAIVDIQSAWHLNGPLDTETALLAMVVARHLDRAALDGGHVKARLVSSLTPAETSELADGIAHRLGATLSILDIASVRDGTLHDTDVDMTISVVPSKSEKRTLVISPYPTEQDYRLLFTACNDLLTQRAKRLLAMYFEYYLAPERYVRATSERTREDVLDTLCSVLEQDGITAPRFREALERREQVDGTAYANVVAIPHGCHSSVASNAISVMVSDRPIVWGTHEVTVVVLIAIEHGMLDDFYGIYEICISMLSQPRHVAALLGAPDAATFIETLRNLR